MFQIMVNLVVYSVFQRMYCLVDMEVLKLIILHSKLTKIISNLHTKLKIKDLTF